VQASTIDSCCHVFCLVCITSWAKVNPLCPCCKVLFEVVQTVADPPQVFYFEPPLADSEEESDQEDDDEEEEEEDEEEEEEEEDAAAGEGGADAEDEYVLDDFVVSDGDAIEYEDSPDEPLDRLDDNQLADSDSGGEEVEEEGDEGEEAEEGEGGGRKRAKRKRRRDRRGRVGRGRRLASPLPTPPPTPAAAAAAAVPATGSPAVGGDSSAAVDFFGKFAFKSGL